MDHVQGRVTAFQYDIEPDGSGKQGTWAVAGLSTLIYDVVQRHGQDAGLELIKDIIADATAMADGYSMTV